MRLFSILTSDYFFSTFQTSGDAWILLSFLLGLLSKQPGQKLRSRVSHPPGSGSSSPASLVSMASMDRENPPRNPTGPCRRRARGGRAEGLVMQGTNFFHSFMESHLSITTAKAPQEAATMDMILQHARARHNRVLNFSIWSDRKHYCQADPLSVAVESGDTSKKAFDPGRPREQ